MINNKPKRIITVLGRKSKHGLTGDRDVIICQKLGMLLAEQEEDIIIQTGGSGGYPAFLSDAYAMHRLSLNKSIDGLIFHYVPKGKEYTTEGLLGVTKGTGKDRFERRKILLELKADAVLTINGGSGTADEINLAHENNHKVICFVGSGGASAGKSIDSKGRSPFIPEDCFKNKILSNKNPDANIDEIVNELLKVLLSN